MDDLIRRSDAIKVACAGADEWDGGCNLNRDEYIEKAINNVPAIEPNLLILPETIEPGYETYIGENIVVVHHDDFMDMKCKAMMWDEYGEEPKRGQWIKIDQYWNRDGLMTIFECSTCKEQIEIPFKPYDFCPYCGAKMKGADDDTD